MIDDQANPKKKKRKRKRRKERMRRKDMEKKRRKRKDKDDLHPNIKNGGKSRTKPMALERKRKYCTIKRNIRRGKKYISLES